MYSHGVFISMAFYLSFVDGYLIHQWRPQRASIVRQSESAGYPIACRRVKTTFLSSLRPSRNEQDDGDKFADFNIDSYLKGEKSYDMSRQEGISEDESLESEVASFYTETKQEDPEQQKLASAIDSFLSGGFDRISDTAPAPHLDLTPAEVIDQSLRALRKLDVPQRSHGAAVFQRFLVPLTRGQRWGDSLRNPSSVDPWKEIQRGALTASMFARRIRASEFAPLLDWKQLDVSDGAFDPNVDFVGNPSVAFVNAALYFGKGLAPVLIQFTLLRVGGSWLIDTARKSEMDFFTNEESDG